MRYNDSVMKVAFDERELCGALLCGQVEANNRPSLMLRTLAGKKIMLVVVDMVRGFCESGKLADPRCAAIVPEIGKIIEQLPAAERVFLCDKHTEHSAELRYFPPHCVGEESEIVPALRRYGGTVVDKNSTNGFVQLLNARSNLLDYDVFVVTGVCTDICVMQLALSLRAYISEFDGKGNVIVPTVAVETYDNALHNADLYNMMALKMMEQSGVMVFKRFA